MGEAQKFVPKFESEGGDPVARAVAQFADPAERALRVQARNYYDGACSLKSQAERLREAADKLDRDAKDELAWSVRCEKAAEELASPLVGIGPSVSDPLHELRERVRRLGWRTVVTELALPTYVTATCEDVVTRFISSNFSPAGGVVNSIIDACNRLEPKVGVDAR